MAAAYGVHDEMVNRLRTSRAARHSLAINSRVRIAAITYLFTCAGVVTDDAD